MAKIKRVRCVNCEWWKFSFKKLIFRYGLCKHKRMLSADLLTEGSSDCGLYKLKGEKHG